jgi:hypothetical protein
MVKTSTTITAVLLLMLVYLSGISDAGFEIGNPTKSERLCTNADFSQTLGRYWYEGDYFYIAIKQLNVTMNFTAARAYCQSILPGASDLVMINSTNNLLIVQYLAQQTVNQAVWIGMNQTSKALEPDRYWKWFDNNTPFNGSWWATGQPDNAGGSQDCGCFMSGQNGFSDCSCSNASLTPVCSIPG